MNVIKVLASVIATLIISGCVGTPDKEGWRYGQKSDFLEILKNDKYASICNDRGLYEKIRKSDNSRLMSQMLVAYTENLANGCIDLDKFESIQKSKKARRIETHYEIYLQDVVPSDILRQLRTGQSIETILAPYIPKNEQFARLLHVYHTQGLKGSIKKEVLLKIRRNLERIKIMDDNLGDNYVLVNIPEFVVRVKKGKKTDLKFAVVVGKKRMQTPIFAAQLQYVTINPQWSVPNSIARNEVIPALLKDPEYLKKNRMVVRSNYNLSSTELAPSIEELESYKGGKGEVPFKFIEVPSKWNGLGRVKFIFPNKHSVYMHDTQSKGLFKRKVRTYSHGCVRLEKPSALLKYIATHYSDTSNEQVQTWYKSFKTHNLKPNTKVMVHTAYLTAYVTDEGKLLMFNDIYGYDKSQKLNF